MPLPDAQCRCANAKCAALTERPARPELRQRRLLPRRLGAAVYQWIKSLGETGVAYDTNNPYVACSKEYTDGFCGA